MTRMMRIKRMMRMMRMRMRMMRMMRMMMMMILTHYYLYILPLHTIIYYYVIYIHILTFLSLALLRWWLWLLFWKDLIWTPKTPKTYMDWLSIHSAFHKAEGPGFQPQKPDVSTSSPLFPGWPSEKYESQLGWWNSQYDGKNEKCSKPPTSLPISFHGLSP